MARHEEDREDLLAEAVAYPRRAEWFVPGEPVPVVVGLRDRSLVIYFGPDPVFQFDSEGRLRRGFVDGALYRSQGTTLARLERERTPEQTILHRHDLSATDCDRLLNEIADRLRALRVALESDHVTTLRAIPSEDDLRSVILARLIPLCEAPLRLAPALK